jgi:hypothetical protein
MPALAGGQTTMPSAEHLAKLRRIGETVYAASAIYSHHLADVLTPQVGAESSYTQFRDGVAAMAVDAERLDASPVGKNEQTRPYVRALLELLDPLRTARECCKSQNELDAAASDATLPATIRDMMRRASSQSSEARTLIVESVHEQFDRGRG